MSERRNVGQEEREREERGRERERRESGLGPKKKKNPKMTKLQTGLNDFEDDIKINLHTLVDLLDKTGGNAHYRKKS